MSIQEEVFGGNTTLWQVLNAQNVPELAANIARLETQLSTLGVTLQNYQADTNAELVTLNTRINRIDTQIESINNNIININNTINSMSSRVTSLENQIMSINNSINTINGQIASMQLTLTSQNTRILNIENSISTVNTQINSLTNRVNDLEEEKGQNNWIRYNTLYSVTEWFNWSPSYTSYRMTIEGNGDYVPMNRMVNTLIGSSRDTAMFGIAIRDIPPVDGAPPAPLMEGLAGVRHSNVIGYRLIYINKTVP